jgi:hypothetical protein
MFSAVSFAQQQPSLEVVPGDLKWQNAPVSWQIEDGNQLTILSGYEPPRNDNSALAISKNAEATRGRLLSLR